MSRAKLAAVGALAAVTLSGCGVAAKPEAGTAQAVAAAHHAVADPRTKHVKCLAADHIPYTETRVNGYNSIQIGSGSSGMLAEFTATPGIAQGVQMAGRSQGAMVIGSALVYPEHASDSLISAVQKCMALGVSG